MKKLGILMAAAMLFVGTATFAGTVKQAPSKAETKKEAKAPTHKTHKKHHTKKAATTAPKAK